jgi:hypothetical protein
MVGLMLLVIIVGIVVVFKSKSIKAGLVGKGAKPPSSFLFLLGGMVTILSAAVRYGDWAWKIQLATDRPTDLESVNSMMMIFIVGGGITTFLGIALLFDELSGRTK